MSSVYLRANFTTLYKTQAALSVRKGNLTATVLFHSIHIKRTHNGGIGGSVQHCSNASCREG